MACDKQCSRNVGGECTWESKRKCMYETKEQYQDRMKKLEEVKIIKKV